MIVKCKTCNENFNLDAEQESLVLDLNTKGATLAMLQCKKCYSWFPLDPQSIGLEGEQVEKPDVVWRTPIPKIHSYTSLIAEDDSDSFYGCGFTGVTWKKKGDFYNAIEDIIEKYPHRAKCYLKSGSEWLPNLDEPTNIEDLIKTELEEDIHGYGD